MTLALLITAATGAWAADTYTITFSGFGNEACNKTVTDATLEYSETFNVTDVYVNYIMLGGVGGSNEYVSISKSQDETQITITVKSAFEGTVNVTVYYMNENWDESERNISVTCVKSAPAVEVTTNKAENDTVFTEAWFNMPAFDATAEYELVRDMSIQMTATMGDGTDGVRYRVKKAQQGGGYEPADMNMMQVLALVAVNDGIEQKALTLDQDFFCRIYKLDEQTLQPEGDGVKLSDFDFAPGLYALKAFAQDDSDYAGETALSNTFKLFQGYEVQVAAKEFITYYKDEALYVEDEAAELYTISSVNGDQAVLSDRSDAMPSNTPMLVYNKSNETKVILLIPCAEPDMAITVAPEFQGTLTGTTIAASTEGQTNYAFNGKAFVFVKNAIEVGPNKAWLSINTGEPSARAITLVFDETTGLSEKGIVNSEKFATATWYDLNGRKLDKMPTKKGVYIMNGRKVVVK